MHFRIKSASASVSEGETDGSSADVGYLKGLRHGREKHYDSSGRLVAWTDYVRGVNQFGKEK